MEKSMRKMWFADLAGKNFAINQETELCTFGPWVWMSVLVAWNFRFATKNSTKIPLTNQQIYGSSIFNNSPRFKVPCLPHSFCHRNYDYNFNLVSWKGLWIKYADPQKTKEVSIMCFGPFSEHIAKAFNIISRHSPSSLPKQLQYLISCSNPDE